jgi:RNA polymerase sigma-70 factor, ECF subfamily
VQPHIPTALERSEGARRPPRPPRSSPRETGMSGAAPAPDAALRADFDRLVGELRPALLRYCARMTGSVVDGEDVVQDALTTAYAGLADGQRVDNRRGWIFRIAHNRAIDFLRHSARRREPFPAAGRSAAEAELPLERQEMAEMALSLFLRLTPLQRSCVFLKDVMGYSLAEIADFHRVRLPATKAALRRGRSALRRLAAGEAPTRAGAPDAAETALLQRYVQHFNARDFDAVRAMLGHAVQLDLVGRTRMQGLSEVSRYFSNYDSVHDWRLSLGAFDGRRAILVHDPAAPGAPPAYVMLLQWEGGRVAGIRDYRYARHVMAEGRPQPEGERG